MTKNRIIATIVPKRIAEKIEYLVEDGRYRSKSDFIYQAILRKLEEDRVGG
ncbi:MAG: hypothetical protein ACE5K0_01015 [Candidatus Methanofastidiosia archaeon]